MPLRVQRYEHATTLMAPSDSHARRSAFLSVRRRVISLEKPDPVGCTVKVLSAVDEIHHVLTLSSGIHLPWSAAVRARGWGWQSSQPAQFTSLCIKSNPARAFHRHRRKPQRIFALTMASPASSSCTTPTRRRRHRSSHHPEAGSMHDISQTEKKAALHSLLVSTSVCQNGDIRHQRSERASPRSAVLMSVERLFC